MKEKGFKQAWLKWNTNGTVEIIQNSKEPPKILHVVFVGGAGSNPSESEDSYTIYDPVRGKFQKIPIK